MEKSSLTRAALGHIAALGDLYDARTDNFCGISLFKKKIPEEALQLVDNHFSDITLLHSDTFTEKCSALEVKAELQVSLLAGLFTLQGAGSYLNDQKTSARAVNSSLIYNIKTKDESVNVYHENLRDAFSIDAIENGIATHVVVGITWGANSVLSFECRNTDNRDVKEIKGDLSNYLTGIKFSIFGKAPVDFNKNTHGKEIQLRIFGDIVPKNQELPTTFEDALNLMKQIPILVGTSNEGRGKPLTYRLISLTLLSKYLSLPTKAEYLIKYLEEESLLRVVQFFEKSSQCKQEINDFYEDAIDYKVCVRPEDLAQIISLKENFAIREAKFRSKLATVLSSVRSGEEDSSELEHLIQEYRSGDYSPDKLSLQFLTWSYITEKCTFAKILLDIGAKYIGFGTSLDEEILKNFGIKTLVFYFKEEAKSAEPNVWKPNRQLFLEEMKKGLDNKYFAVDCDIHSELWPKIGTCIQVIRNGVVLTENLLEAQMYAQSIPLARSTLGMEKIFKMPNNRAKVVMQCTGNFCQPNIEYEWMCSECGEQIEYDFVEYFYCACGRAMATSYEFRCTDDRHVTAYDTHAEKYLADLLSRLRAFKEMNILILGETGVGKSTWINGFINFLHYDSLQEAEASELITLIPSKFTICDEDYNYFTISTGTDDNEVQETGQSATQACKVYPFDIKDMKIRIIDTPGIGDPRGIHQDKINFQNILSTIPHLDELHGICILLKPNNSRLTVMFRFCIQELLTYLHKDASHNIMFCFTHTSGTSYRPGETLRALRALLKENKDVEIPTSPHTLYCFDNEAYRFLAAVKNETHVRFSEDEREKCAKSWKKSLEETNRMLKHIHSLKPHPIQNTLSLNHARELVLTLTEPLAEISKIIRINCIALFGHLKEIESTEENIKDLKKKLTYEKSFLETIPLDYAQLVCSNKNCIKNIGPPENMQIEYLSVCYDHTSKTQEVFHHVYLWLFSTMRIGNCGHCHHSYREHRLIYNRYRHILIQEVNESVKQLLETNMSAKDIKEKWINEEKCKIQEYNQELQDLQEASVKFACFLKHNAITPYNDAMLEYLDLLIHQEKSKIRQGGLDKTIEALEDRRASYKNEIEIMTEAMERGDTSKVPKAVQIEEIVRSLYKLKHYGKKLEEALNVVKASKQKTIINQQIEKKSRKPLLRFNFNNIASEISSWTFFSK